MPEYLLYCFLFLVLSLLVGGVLPAWRTGNPWLAVFRILLMGSVVPGVAYALWKTGGQTYLMVFALVYVGGCWYLRKSHQWGYRLLIELFQNNVGPLGVVAVSLLLSFGLFYFRHADLQSGLYVLHTDFYFYGRVASFISSTGIESPVADVYSYVSGGPSPYHFMELWLGAFVGNLFKLNMALSFYLIVLPVFTNIFLVGLLAVAWERHGRLAWWHYVLALLMLFVSCMGFMDASSLLSHIYRVSPMAETVYGYPKLVIAGSALLLVWHGVKEQRGEWFVSLGGLLYPVILPAFFGGYALWSLYRQLIGGRDLGEWILGLIYPLLTAGMLAGFYLILGRGLQSGGGESLMPQWMDFYLSRYGLLSVGYNLVFVMFSMLSTLGLYVVLYYWAVGKSALKVELTDRAGLMAAMVLVGAGAFSLLLYLDNSWQLHQNVFVNVVVLAVFIMSLNVLERAGQWWQRLPVFIWLGISIWINGIRYDGDFGRGRPINQGFYKELQAEISGLDTVRYGYVKNYGLGASSSDKNPWFKTVGDVMGQYDNNYFPIALGVFDFSISPYPISQALEKSYVEKHVLHSFAEDLKARGDYVHTDDAVRQFVLRYRVNVIFFELDAASPEWLESLPAKVLINKEEGVGCVVVLGFGMDTIIGAVSGVLW